MLRSVPSDPPSPKRHRKLFPTVDHEPAAWAVPSPSLSMVVSPDACVAHLFARQEWRRRQRKRRGKGFDPLDQQNWSRRWAKEIKQLRTEAGWACQCCSREDTQLYADRRTYDERPRGLLCRACRLLVIDYQEYLHTGDPVDNSPDADVVYLCHEEKPYSIMRVQTSIDLALARLSGPQCVQVVITVAQVNDYLERAERRASQVPLPK